MPLGEIIILAWLIIETMTASLRRRRPDGGRCRCWCRMYRAPNWRRPCGVRWLDWMHGMRPRRFGSSTRSRTTRQQNETWGGGAGRTARRVRQAPTGPDRAVRAGVPFGRCPATFLTPREKIGAPDPPGGGRRPRGVGRGQGEERELGADRAFASDSGSDSGAIREAGRPGRPTSCAPARCRRGRSRSGGSSRRRRLPATGRAGAGRRGCSRVR